MQYKNLGKSGLMVSELCLGTMTFGWGTHEKDAHHMLNLFVEQGGNFIDTADIYAEGASETIIGNWLKNKNRNDFIIATKVRFSTGDNVNATGLSRKHIIAGIEESLRRLQTDYIDLYQVHCWHESTPLEETLRTLDDLVRAGKVRYIGVSNFTGWQLQKALDISRFGQWEMFITFQGLYNILDRHIEWDIIPVCQNESLGLLCWSPLAGGWLSGKIQRGMREPPKDSRIVEAEQKGWSESWSHYDNEHTWKVLDEVFTVAQLTGKSPAQVSINWLRTRDVVTCPILGARTLEQFQDNMSALKWQLDDEMKKRLNTVSEISPPRYPYGFINRFK